VDNELSYEQLVSGFINSTTNNQMELTAVIKGLEHLKSTGNVSDNIIVYTDSIYVKSNIEHWIKKWLTNGWKKSNNKEVKNRYIFRFIVFFIL